MSDSTGRLALPYIVQSQSQKEVTHNEALTMLDILLHPVAISEGDNIPPVSPVVGDCYIVGTSPTGAWIGKAKHLAQAQIGGGWFFVAPFTRFKCWVNEHQEEYVYDGSSWVPSALLSKSAGDYLRLSYISEDIAVLGASTNSTIVIPNRAIVIAVNLRVTQAITGATSFNIGVSGDAGRYGTGVGVALDSTNIGLASGPLAYYSDTPLLLTAIGSDFISGEVSIAVQYLLPRGPWTF